MPDFFAVGSNSGAPAPKAVETLELARERWDSAIQRAEDPSLESAARAVFERPANKALADAVFAYSPFLTHCMASDIRFAVDLFHRGPDASLDAVLSDIAALRAETPEADLKKALRIAKRRAALTVALADIAGVWPLERVTEALSDVADGCLRAAAAFAIREAQRRGGLTLRHPEDPEIGSGLVVLGMGKLGARELNYSSDIDIIVFYDPNLIRTDQPDALQNTMTRIARMILRVMDERTVDGYVFRTDLRLRPDPGATPLAISVLAAESYYESLGQNWERAAMIKARPVAGDIDAGHAFLEWLTPFVWRKSLDFAAIQDIHSIKRQIDIHRGGGRQMAPDLAGHNVKLGTGGIREIEFFAQTQQLIWGGRLPALRLARTKDAIDALVSFEQCAPETATDLKASYDSLRRIEHRLQMVNDEQTHRLPEDPAAMDTFARFMGFDGAAPFIADLTGHLTRVQDHCGKLFEDAPALTAGGDMGGNLVFTGADQDPDTLETLAKLGFKEPARADAQIRAWHHGRYRAMRSTRAREILTELVPVLLRAMSTTPDPDETFLRFDGFLKALPSGVQLFSMFQANPQLSELVVRIIGKAPRLARHMGSNASVLDAVLTRDFFDGPPDRDFLRAELADSFRWCGHMEAYLEAVRRWANDRRFQVGVLHLEGKIDPATASKALSEIAETALRGLIPVVAAEFADAHGAISGGRLAIVALGRLGSREMTASSDLDLIFVYDAPELDSGGGVPSDGPKPLAASQYYARLTQRCLNAITALTAEGSLYEVDMRLRPSGTKGPIATSFAAFRQYYEQSAWTWERLALVRARVVAYMGGLEDEVEAMIRGILADPLPADALLRDTAHMRARLAEGKKPAGPWDVKNIRGGLVDIAFLTQYLVLAGADRDPDLADPNTHQALMNLKQSGVLDAADAETLITAETLWMGLLGILALTIEGDVTPEKEEQISGALAEDLVRIGGALDFDDLKRKVSDTAGAVYALFQKIIEDPAARLPK
ncbi:MAG: bifunctional [glutamine synthetase] adenylyltransferase/[glutamine synthetase]-adenylyl-L-tyrosine phosphorylase [Rhodospirillaceae bacterium]